MRIARTYFHASFEDAAIVPDTVRQQILRIHPYLHPRTVVRGPYIRDGKYYYTWASATDNPDIFSFNAVVSDTPLGKVYPQRRKHAT